MIREQNTIVLFTESFPYDFAREDTFLRPEVPHLVRAFGSVIIVPLLHRGRKVDLPAYVCVDESVAERRLDSPLTKLRWLCSALTSASFYEELCRYPRVLREPAKLKKLVFHAALSSRIRGWVRRYIDRGSFKLDVTIFYTYWLSAATSGIGSLKRIYPDLKLVSRAHGSDIYEEKIIPPYIPFRERALQGVDRLYCVSENGMKYLTGKCAINRDRIRVSRLGVRNRNIVNKPSTDGTRRIISCAFMIPIKRIELIARTVAEYGKLSSSSRIEWYHIGDGPMFDEVNELAERAMPDNVTAHLMGYLDNKEIYDFYRNTPLDLFISLSSTEGIPVTIMEAISCGIPVIATDVGGTREIVNERTGKLLPPHPDPVKAAQSIASYFVGGYGNMELRNNCRSYWESHYSAETNYDSFVRDMVALLG